MPVGGRTASRGALLPILLLLALAGGRIATALAEPPGAAPGLTASGAAAKSSLPAAARPTHPPEPLSPWTFVTGEIEHLVARGELPVEALTFRPVDRGKLALWLATYGTADTTAEAAAQRAAEIGAAREAPCRRRLLDVLGPAGEGPGSRGVLLGFSGDGSRLRIMPFLRFMPVFARGTAPVWSDSTRLGFRAVYQAGPALSITTGFYAAEIEESAGFADPLIAGTDLILHADEATLSARLGALRLRLGRDRHHWGPGASGSLLLAESAEPFDFVEYEWRVGRRLRFLALTGETNRAAAGDSAARHVGRVRYLSAHRLHWEISPRWSLALAEGARYQRSSPPLPYLAGLLPYTLVERLEQQDEPSGTADDALRNNVLWSLEGVWRPRPGWMLYCEILVDDIGTTSAETPMRGGAQLGCTFAPRWRGWDWTLGVEAARVSNYTYAVYYQDLCQCDWEHQQRPIGYAPGPDAALLLLRCAVDPAPAWAGRAWLEVLHQGAGRLGEAWRPSGTGCDPAGEPACGDVEAWSLAEPVVRRLAIGGEVRYRPDPLAWFGVSLERRAWDGEGSGGRGGEIRLRLSASAGL